MFLEETKRKIRVRRIAKFYKRYLKRGDKILDIGCGDGKTALELQSALGIKLYFTGVDIIPYSPPFKFVVIKTGGLLGAT